MKKLGVNIEMKELEVRINEVVSKESTKSSKMIELFELGLEIKEISKIMEVRYNFVYNVIQNYTIKNEVEIDRSKETTTKDKILELSKEGLSKIEIAKTLKKDYNYVWQTLNK